MAATLLAAAVKSVAGSESGVARVVNKLPQARTNVSANERWLSLIAGGTVAGLCLSGRTPPLLSTILGTGLIYRAMTGNCVLYQALGVSTADSTRPQSAIAAGHGTRVDHAVIVNRPASEVYEFWRDLENLPRFMTHLVDVDTTTDGRSHWVAKGPLGLKAEWDAEIVTDVPNKLIAWKSLDGADVDTAGSVHFTELPGDHGTEVRVELKYDPPAGKLGTAVAKLVGRSPEEQVKADMRRFKQIMEAGEVPTTQGQPHGQR
ncbi:MAG: DUF2892 domain-containing protein [Planctomycetes bacterium]|nr:DUF2892 domain-containing protein [Planctomycetota bacterium]